MSRLKPLQRGGKRDRFAVIDIETKDGETQKGGFTRPFLVGLYNGDNYIKFSGEDCIERSLSFILSREFAGTIYYAHNGGSFDWLHYLHAIKDAGYSAEILTIASSIQVLEVTDKSRKHRWKFYDSYKLAPLSLHRFSRAMGVETVKQEGFSYDTHEADERWIDYNRDDCVALYQSIERYYELIEELGGSVGVTAASTAMRTYRTGYQRRDFFRHVGHHKFFREAYYGGRVENFVTRAGGLRVYDINSAYPYSMVGIMPVGSMFTAQGPVNSATTTGYCGFIRARVEVPENVEIPVLPYRRDGKLIFPVGRFSGVWTSIELEAAELQGAVVAREESVWIRGHDVFSEYVDSLFILRDTTRPGYDAGRAEIAKILLNSTYGKFGMKTERDKVYILGDGVTHTDLPFNSKPIDPEDPECAVYTLGETVDADYIIPQISAWVTAKARLLLHRYLVTAAERGVLAYCDTDSIITSACLDDLVGSVLGAIKNEGATAARKAGYDTEPLYDGVFLQPKLYALYANNIVGGAPVSSEYRKALTKVTMKGYKSRKLSDFEAIQRGGSITYESLEKVGMLARREFASPPRLRTVTKQLRDTSHKRVFEGAGSRPIKLNEW